MSALLSISLSFKPAQNSSPSFQHSLAWASQCSMSFHNFLWNTAIPHNPGTNICPIMQFLLLWQNTTAKLTWRGGGEFIWLTLQTLFTTKGSQNRNSNETGTCRQVLMQRPWIDPSYRLPLMAYSACIFIEPRATTQGWSFLECAGSSPIKH